MRLSGPPEEFTREFSLVLTVDEGSVIYRCSAACRRRPVEHAARVRIERRLKEAKIFTIANVNITVNASQNQRTIIVGGSVNASGRQLWIQGLTLTGAISAAGGRGDFAGDGIKVIRAAGRCDTAGRRSGREPGGGSEGSARRHRRRRGRLVCRFADYSASRSRCFRR